jgi:predicted small lipoprotein YifL
MLEPVLQYVFVLLAGKETAMKTLFAILTLALALSACGQSNPSAPADNRSHGHDHFHSHEGETITLGTATLGDLTVEAFQKDKPRRGQTSYFEIQFRGEVDAARVQAEILGPDGQRVIWLGLHPMAQKGRFGAHAGLPADAPKDLKLRITLKDATPAQAEFAIKE